MTSVVCCACSLHRRSWESGGSTKIGGGVRRSGYYLSHAQVLAEMVPHGLLEILPARARVAHMGQLPPRWSVRPIVPKRYRCSDILGVHSLSSRRYTQSQSHIHRIPLDRRSLPPHCAACTTSSAAQRFRGAGAAVYADGVRHITCCCMLHVACCMLGSASRGPPAGTTIL